MSVLSPPVCRPTYTDRIWDFKITGNWGRIPMNWNSVIVRVDIVKEMNFAYGQFFILFVWLPEFQRISLYQFLFGTGVDMLIYLKLAIIPEMQTKWFNCCIIILFPMCTCGLTNRSPPGKMILNCGDSRDNAVMKRRLILLHHFAGIRSIKSDRLVFAHLYLSLNL